VVIRNPCAEEELMQDKRAVRMQDAFVADVGDFGKYILLSLLSSAAGDRCRLGINWYYQKGEGEGGGAHTSYLAPGHPAAWRYRACNPVLYDALGRIVREERRHLAAVERSPILPRGTATFSVPLPDPKAVPPERRVAARKAWFRRSEEALAERDLLFLDPDNGIQPKELSVTGKFAGKFALVDEIARYAEGGATLIIYNHRDRRPKPAYDRKLVCAARAAGCGDRMRVLRARRMSVRDFIILPRPEDLSWIDPVLESATTGPLSFLFSPYLVTGV
jgi:hypothetical protein